MVTTVGLAAITESLLGTTCCASTGDTEVSEELTVSYDQKCVL